MRILIAGAGGQVGSSIAQYLKQQGHDITGSYHNYKPQLEGIELVSLDLEKDSPQNAGYDMVIDFAAQIRSSHIVDQVRGNIKTTANLLRFAEKNHISRFIYMSTYSVYGEVNGSVSEESDRINPDDYGITKYAAERIVEESEIPFRMVIRLPRILGRNTSLKYPWIPLVAGRMKNNLPVNYYNPALLYNNFIHTDELGRFLDSLAWKESWLGFHTLGLGAGDHMKVIDILRMMKEELNSRSEFILTEAPDKSAAYSIDISKALFYGFQPMGPQQALKLFCSEIRGGGIKLFLCVVSLLFYPLAFQLILEFPNNGFSIWKNGGGIK